MKVLSNIFEVIWQAITGQKEISALSSQITILGKRIRELEAYNLRLEMQLKQKEDEAARVKKWEESDDDAKKQTLKSRFNR
jgi:hypothetical protein